jgi:hypothetical protein
MLGLTSIDLPFLGNLRSKWVVVIGLELLSHTCPSLDLGSYMLHHVTYVTLVNVMVTLILLVWKIGPVQGFVRCDAGSLWLVIIPKSKDRFM